MKSILLNLALIDLIRFCQENDIPPNGPNGEGSHVVKRPRGFTYDLVSTATGEPIATVRFHKNQVPTHHLHTATP